MRRRKTSRNSAVALGDVSANNLYFRRELSVQKLKLITQFLSPVSPTHPAAQSEAGSKVLYNSPKTMLTHIRGEHFQSVLTLMDYTFTAFAV
jgi:hypothetical protein